jgi:hypothetical protein
MVLAPDGNKAMCLGRQISNYTIPTTFQVESRNLTIENKKSFM